MTRASRAAATTELRAPPPASRGLPRDVRWNRASGHARSRSDGSFYARRPISIRAPTRRLARSTLTPIRPMRHELLSLSFLCVLCACASTPALPPGDAIGETLEARDTVRFSVVDANPPAFFEQTLLVEATVVAVCQSAGCWMQVEDEGQHRDGSLGVGMRRQVRLPQGPRGSPRASSRARSTRRPSPRKMRNTSRRESWRRDRDRARGLRVQRVGHPRARGLIRAGGQGISSVRIGRRRDRCLAHLRCSPRL